MKISKKSEDLIKKELHTDLTNIIICSIMLFVLGAISLYCTINLGNINGYVTAIIAVSVIAILCGIVIFVFGLIYSRRKIKEFKHYVERFTFGTEGATKAVALNYPDPLVVVSVRDGMIMWYNPSFEKMCVRKELYGTKLNEIFPSIRLNDFMSSKKSVRDFSYAGRDYILTGSLSSDKDTDESLLYIGIGFTDISETVMLQKQLDEKKSVVCVAIIDNYDEVLKETPNTNHGALIGDIERCIRDWVEKGEGFYRRYERDKFIILFENARFEELCNEKFSVLSDVKEIDQQNKIPVTLSIGAGVISDDIKENDKIALSAVDMALGRGGDQAVVKTEDGYLFFGARSLGVEKTTQVKARVVAQRLGSLMDEAKNIVIMGHKNGDYDSFGASCGLFKMAKNKNKDVYIALEKGSSNVGTILKDIMINSEYAEGIVSYDRAAAVMGKDTLLIVVDTHRANMVEYPELFERSEKTVLIDHHRRGEDYIDNTVLAYLEPYASSTSEMITEVLRYDDDVKGISVQEAEALYCGIYLDTKGFTFKTGARTFEAAAYLRKAGVDPVGVRKIFRNDISMHIQKSRVISNARIYRDNIAIAVCEEEAKNIQLIAAQTADDLLDMNGVEASFVLASTGNRIVISGRSLGNVNVQVILEKLGGGGHITIAGAQLENSSLTMAELKLQNAIDEVLFD